jgi:aspartate/methionine/tyrosine aminotransferase
MKLPIFKLEEYLEKWEFKAPYLFCNSDLETLSLKELLSYADPEGMSYWENLRLGYTEVSGSIELRRELSQLYQKIGSEQVLTFAGAEEGIFATFQALLTSLDHVIVVTPCYQSLQSIPESIGCQFTPVSLDSSLNWHLDLKQIEKAIRPNTRMIIINFPHNPTGTVLKENELKELVEIARSRGIYLFSDEVYRWTELEPENQMIPAADLYERAISLGVLSKGFGLAGLRIGWIATQDAQVRQKLTRMKHYLSICNSGPSEVLALIALRAKEKIIARNHQLIRENLALLDPFFQKYSQVIHWTRPTGGCIGFPHLEIKKPIEAVAEQLIEEEGVLILPGNAYSFPGNYFRIGFGRKSFPEGLVRFERFLERNI